MLSRLPGGLADEFPRGPHSSSQTHHLRLCHRRCYVNDLVRNQTFQLTHELEPPEERREIVPCNQTVFEIFYGPQVQHWLARRLAKGDGWQVVRYSYPWPKGMGWGKFNSRTVLRMARSPERRAA